MKNILITLDNNVLFRLVVNMSRSRVVAFGDSVVCQHDRSWFDNAITVAVSVVDELLLPITISDSCCNQNEISFTLQPIGGASSDRLALLIESSLVSVVYKQWNQARSGAFYDELEPLQGLKHVVLGVGVKFNRKNEK